MFLFMHDPERRAPHSGEAEKAALYLATGYGFTPYNLLGRGLADLLHFAPIV
jgi:hypothetical protein